MFHRDIQTPKRDFKIRGAAESFFLGNSKCLDNGWNTVKSPSKSMLIKTGYPNMNAAASHRPQPRVVDRERLSGNDPRRWAIKAGFH